MESFSSPKIQSLDAAIADRKAWKAAGKRVVLTNGCFDILHVGHLAFLEAARAEGDFLVVCLNSDASVRALKGPDRPINKETHRAFSLAALSAVDRVVIFNSPRLVSEIEALKPDVYCKAGDYSIDSLHGGERAALAAVGADIRFLSFAEGFSTTRMIEKLKQAGAL